MADVPLTVAVISTISPVVAGALPLVTGWLRDAGRDKRGQAERLAQQKREGCVTLLRLARDFRVHVENAHEFQGPDLTTQVQEIRQAAADINGQADEVGFMLPTAETTASALA